MGRQRYQNQNLSSQRLKQRLLSQRRRLKVTRKLIPLVLTPLLLAADQTTKLVVERTMPLGQITKIWGEFLWFWHVRNTAMAFSLGSALPAILKTIVSIVLPLVVLIAILIYYLRTDELTLFQRWSFAAILGGGLGNIVDRFARSEGVVDFVSVKFYGIFGLQRWPTFNVADSSVVVGGILLLASFFIQEVRSKK